MQLPEELHPPLPPPHPGPPGTPGVADPPPPQVRLPEPAPAAGPPTRGGRRPRRAPRRPGGPRRTSQDVLSSAFWSILDDPFSRTVLMAERCFRGGMGSRAKVARVVAIETPDNSASEEEEEQQEIQVRGFLIQLPS